MARLQILELPEGTGDDRPPFALVIDQYEPPPYPDEPEPSPFDGIAEKIGARAVLIFDDTIDIPANASAEMPDLTGNSLDANATLTRFRALADSLEGVEAHGGAWDAYQHAARLIRDILATRQEDAHG
jgi:hypothetical protein